MIQTCQVGRKVYDFSDHLAHLTGLLQFTSN